MDTVKLKINGQDIEAAAGKTILEVVRERELDAIPTLCHSSELEPYASCFLCLVEIKGRPNLVPACATRVAQGIEVTTRNDRIIRSRRTALAANVPLNVVDEVDLDRYVGRWYEIASFPQRFQRGCVATTAHYTLRDDGRIRVENECRDGSFDGELRRVEGVAWVTDPDETRAKLKVQFFWPFSGDYWIIALDPEYRYAVVGHPSRDYLWILARTRSLDPAVYETLRADIEAQGYDLERLNRTPQPPSS